MPSCKDRRTSVSKVFSAPLRVASAGRALNVTATALKDTLGGFRGHERVCRISIFCFCSLVTTAGWNVSSPSPARRTRRAHRLPQPLNEGERAAMRCRPGLSIAAVNRSTHFCGGSRHRGIPAPLVPISNEGIHDRTKIHYEWSAHSRPHPLDRRHRISCVHRHRRIQSILAPVLSRSCRHGRRRSRGPFLFHSGLRLLLSAAGFHFLEDVKFDRRPTFFLRWLIGCVYRRAFFHHRKQSAADASNPLNQHSPDGFPRLLDR